MARRFQPRRHLKPLRRPSAGDPPSPPSPPPAPADASAPAARPAQTFSKTQGETIMDVIPFSVPGLPEAAELAGLFVLKPLAVDASDPESGGPLLGFRHGPAQAQAADPQSDGVMSIPSPASIIATSALAPRTCCRPWSSICAAPTSIARSSPSRPISTAIRC
jgi:hypothetical protein